MSEQPPRFSADPQPFDQETFLRQLETFVKENIQPAVDNATRCVDGRYDTNDEGKIAFAGADLGLVMALVAVNKVAGLNMNLEECFDYLYEIVSEEGRFCMHTDDHDHSDGGIGCGHATKAANLGSSHDYIGFLFDETQDPDIQRTIEQDFQQDMSNLIAYATQRAVSDDIENVVLRGSHGEKGVVIVDSEEYTIRHQGNDGGQYFVFDRARANRYVEKIINELVVKLESKGIQFTERHRNMFLDAFIGQTNATLHHLAKGQGIAQVQIDQNGESQISFVQIVD